MNESTCLSIVDNWIKSTKDRQIKKQLLTLKDFIMDDLEYTHRSEAMLKMSEFIDSREQNKEMIIIRKYINL